MAVRVFARSSSVNADLDALARAGVELEAALHAAAERLFHQQGLGAQLHGVVVPGGRPAVVVARGGAVLRLDGVRRAVLLLDHVEDAADAERLRRQVDAAAAVGVAFLARLVGQVRLIHAAVVEQAALDVLVGRHHAHPRIGDSTGAGSR